MRTLFLFCYFGLVLIADQFTKAAALGMLREGETVEVIPKLFNLTLWFNPGAAFGLFAGLPETQRKWALISVSLIAFLVVFFMMRETKDDKLSQFALVGVMAGAIGNLIDRFRHKGVVDFLDFYWAEYHWPAFNIADSAISVGVAILMFRLLFAGVGENRDSAVSL